MQDTKMIKNGQDRDQVTAFAKFNKNMHTALHVLAPKSAKSRESPTEFKALAGQDHQDLAINRKRICDFLLVINSNFGHISYNFWDIDV